MIQEPISLNPLVARALGFSELQQYVVDCAVRVFESYDVGATYVVGDTAASLRGHAVMAVVGYASPSMVGAVLLLAPRAFVEALVPEELRRRPVREDVALRDVLGEFTNMIAGRLKNRLALHDLEPLLTPPTTVFGDDLALPAPVSGLSAWHRFETAHGNIFIRFDAAFDATFSLSRADASKEPSVHEGEAIVWEEEQ
jgi:CheY-specific phosphatase CheX